MLDSEIEALAKFLAWEEFKQSEFFKATGQKNHFDVLLAFMCGWQACGSEGSEKYREAAKEIIEELK